MISDHSVDVERVVERGDAYVQFDDQKDNYSTLSWPSQPADWVVVSNKFGYCQLSGVLLLQDP